MRLSFSAATLWLLVRPSLRRGTAVQWRAVIPLGLVFVATNTAYLRAISRLPIGVAATVELLGPLTSSIALSHRPEHLAVALLAPAGVLLLTGPGASLPAGGLMPGGAAALCRAGYVALSRRVGRPLPDRTGLALALACGGCVLTAVSAVTDGVAVATRPAVLLAGLLVALLSR
ncbi:hypothetical protein [Streptomyces sp. NPDC048295]|uniref:EamA family transporter n=1 Tax=Streptomyces sp. NPDC048295 TaxID=3154617 RepID=UPI003413BE2A